MGSQRTSACLALSNFRLLVLCGLRLPDDDDHVSLRSSSSLSLSAAAAEPEDVLEPQTPQAQRIRLRQGADMSCCIPLGLLRSVELSGAGHVQSGLSSKGDRKATTDTLSIIVRCKDVRSLVLHFSDNLHAAQLGRARVLYQRLEHILANAADQPAAFLYGARGRRRDWHRYQPVKEFRRQGVFDDEEHEQVRQATLSKWCRTPLNSNYNLCSTYPRVLFVPRAAESLAEVGACWPFSSEPPLSHV